MAITHTTSVSAFDDSSASSIQAPAITVAANDLLISSFTWGGTGGGGTIGDNLGNTWTPIQTQISDANGQSYAAFYSTVTNAGSSTVSASFSANGFRRIMVSQYAGAASAAPLDDSDLVDEGSATTATDNAATPDLSPTQDGDLIWCGISIPSANQTYTAGTSFTKRGQSADTTGAPIGHEDFTQSTAAAIPGRWTLGTATTGHLDMFSAAFKAAATGTTNTKSGQAVTALYGNGDPAEYVLLLPSADSVDGAWTDELGGTALAASIDETAISDADYIQSEVSPVDSGCRVKLASGSDPVSSSGHTVKWRNGKNPNPSATCNMIVTLRQGGGNVQGAGTQIATFTRNGVTSFTTYEEALSGAEADAITDYTDLYLEFYADQA